MATFGQTTQGDTPASYGDEKVVSRFTLSVAGDVSKLTLDCAGGAGGAQLIRGILFTNGGGNDPAALLGTVTPFSIAQSAARAWVDLVFAAPIALGPGEYHLGIHLDNSSNALIYHRSTGNGRKRSNDTYSDGTTDPFGTVNASDSYELAIYATYTSQSPPFANVTITA